MKKEADRMPPQPPILPRSLPQSHELPSLPIGATAAPSVNTVYGLSLVSEELPLPTKLAEHVSQA